MGKTPGNTVKEGLVVFGIIAEQEQVAQKASWGRKVPREVMLTHRKGCTPGLCLVQHSQQQPLRRWEEKRKARRRLIVPISYSQLSTHWGKNSWSAFLNGKEGSLQMCAVCGSHRGTIWQIAAAKQWMVPWWPPRLIGSLKVFNLSLGETYTLGKSG